jgi:hypothetical protein
MRSSYKPDDACCCDYYNGQAGGGMPYYSGTTLQHGAGVGDILKGLFRSAVPILKSIGKKVLPKIARAGIRTVSDIVLRKKNPKHALIANAGRELEGLIGDTIKAGKSRGKKRKKIINKVAKRARFKENY